MSVMIALKHGDAVCLATDSRFMNPDFTTVYSDSVQKIYPVGSEGFIATNGFKVACDFQQTRAPEIARELGTADIEAIAAALARESIPVMVELISALHAAIRSAPGWYEDMRQAVSGEGLLHTTTLIGRNSEGEAGYVTISFRVVMDQVIAEKAGAYFGRERKMQFSAGDPALKYMLQTLGRDTRVRDWPLTSAVRLVLRDVKAKSARIGGPDQIAIVDSNGARWVNRLSANNEAPRAIKSTESKAIGSLTAQFTGTATFQSGTSGPLVQISSTGIVIEHDGSNYIQITSSGIVFGGSYAINAGNVSSGYPASSIAAGTFSVGVNLPGGQVTGAGTMGLTILANGSLPSGVSYTGSIGCGQLVAGTITATVTIQSPTLNSPTINSATIGAVSIDCSSVNIPLGAINVGSGSWNSYFSGTNVLSCGQCQVGNGASGTFTSGSHTLTVTNGIVTGLT